MNHKQFNALCERVKQLIDSPTDSVRAAIPFDCNSRAETVRLSYNMGWTKGDCIQFIIHNEFNDYIKEKLNG